MNCNKKFFLNYFKVSFDYVGQRIDNFLFSKIKSLSRNKIYSLIRKGNIRVNKKRVLPKYKLNYNDLLRIPLIKFDKIFKIKFLNKKILLKFNDIIVYEDKYLLVINKPSGIPVHGGTNVYYNIMNILKFLNPELKYLELIHRIDKNTSGILMIAKKRSMLRLLHSYFRDNKIKKVYIALVHGHWPNLLKKVKNKIIINKIYKGFLKKKKTKKSISFVYVRKYYDKYTLLYINPLTGRKHQIRIHTSLNGHPIVFDNIYGNYDLDKDMISKYNFKRFFLHSYSVCFFHPYYRKNIYIKAKLSSELLLCLNKLSNK